MSIQILLLGSGCVGKVASVLRETCGVFYCEFEYHFDDTYSLKVKINNKEISIKITVIPGQEEFSALIPLHARKANGFIIMYSITEISTFQSIEDYYNTIKNIKGTTNIPLLICGNQSDLSDQRKVSKSEGEELAKRLGAEFLETSAKDNINIKEMFETIVHLVLQNPETIVDKEEESNTQRKRENKEICFIN